MSERIDIQEHVKAICKALDLEAADVLRLDITATDVSAEVFKLNENGKKYVEAETLATQTFDFKVVA